MGQILVSGLIHIETTLQIDGFPVQYSPARYPFFGINSTAQSVILYDPSGKRQIHVVLKVIQDQAYPL